MSDTAKQVAERETTRMAKAIAKRVMGSEAMWQMFLMDAYREYYRPKAAPTKKQKRGSRG